MDNLLPLCKELLTITDPLGNTALHIAVQEKDLEEALALLKNRASIEIENRGGDTPEDLASDNIDMKLLFQMVLCPTLLRLLNDWSWNYHNITLKEYIDDIISLQATVNIYNINLPLCRPRKFRRPYHNSPLDLAVKEGDLQSIAWLHQHRSPLNRRGFLQQTAIHTAVHFNQGEALMMLIGYGVSLDSVDESGDTPLHIAAQMGHSAMLPILQQHGAALDARNKNGNTPLHVAALTNKESSMRYLIENNVDLEERNNENETPLHVAASHGGAQACSLLLSHQAQVDAINQNGVNPWKCALIAAGRLKKEQRDDLLQSFLKYHPDLLSKPCDFEGNYALQVVMNSVVPIDLTKEEQKNYFEYLSDLIAMEPLLVGRANSKGRTPLHCAVYFDCAEWVQLLLDGGADPTVKDSDGNNVFHFAIIEKSPFELLFSHNNDLLYVKNGKGQYPVDIAIEDKDEILATEILKLGMAGYENTWKSSLFHRAAAFGMHSLLSWLQKNAQDLSIISKDSRGRTPLLVAIEAGCSKAIQYLLDNTPKDSFDTDNDQNTMLHYLVRYANVADLNYAISVRSFASDLIPMNPRNRNGETLFACALISGREQNCVWLMNKGVEWLATPRLFPAIATGCMLQMLNQLETKLGTPKLLEACSEQIEQQLTPLHLAVRSAQNPAQHFPFIDRLIALGVSANSLLEIALNCRNELLIIHLLQQHKAQLDAAAHRGRTLVHVVAREGMINVLEYLASQSDINLNTHAGDLGQTPLHEAVLGRNPAAVRLLLSKGVSCQEVNRVARTPQNLAEGELQLAIRTSNEKEKTDLQLIIKMLKNPNEVNSVKKPANELPVELIAKPAATVQKERPTVPVVFGAFGMSQSISSEPSSRPSKPRLPVKMREGYEFNMGRHRLRIDRTEGRGYCGMHALMGNYDPHRGMYHTNITRNQMVDHLRTSFANHQRPLAMVLYFVPIVEYHLQQRAQGGSGGDYTPALADAFYDTLNIRPGEALPDRNVIDNNLVELFEAYLDIIGDDEYTIVTSDMLIIAAAYNVEVRIYVLPNFDQTADQVRNYAANEAVANIANVRVIYLNGGHYSRCTYLGDRT